MSFVERNELPFLRTLSQLAFANPFSRDWVDLEHDALGIDRPTQPKVHWLEEGRYGETSTLLELDVKVEDLAERLAERLAAGAKPTTDEAEIYQRMILYLLYRRYRLQFDRLIADTTPKRDRPKADFWWEFHGNFNRYLSGLHGTGQTRALQLDCAHVFSCFFQIRRAFQQIFWCIVGRSQRSILLRQEVWKSIFTHDMGRYLRILHGRMNDVNTLITGPTGTGKELVAAAVGLSQYIPFDSESQQFAVNFRDSFHPLNLSAIPAGLIESQLFGHTGGAFTDAKIDREGWLHKCSSPHSAIFLDEIGEVSKNVQVKLLRVLENRVFQQVGDTEDIAFQSKIVAATNRDLAAEVDDGRFRQDLYYRLSADTINTPSLREQLDDCPDDLHTLVPFFARKVLQKHCALEGNRVETAEIEKEAESLTAEVEDWIAHELDDDYEWPGNMRELEQCVRSIMVRKSYRAVQPREPDLEGRLDGALRTAADYGLTAKELERRYCDVVWEKTGTYQQGARLLGMNRQTFKKRLSDEAPETSRAHGRGKASASGSSPRHPR